MTWGSRQLEENMIKTDFSASDCSTTLLDLVQISWHKFIRVELKLRIHNDQLQQQEILILISQS